MICEKCGATVEVGEWPFCPHGAGHSNVNGDEIVGGFVQENFGPTPEVFYSKSDMARRAKELGLQPYVKWAGPHDRHVSRWAEMDPYTLAAAAALVNRVAEQGSRGSAPTVQCETLSTSVTRWKGEL